MSFADDSTNEDMEAVMHPNFTPSGGDPSDVEYLKVVGLSGGDGDSDSDNGSLAAKDSLALAPSHSMEQTDASSTSKSKKCSRGMLVRLLLLLIVLVVVLAVTLTKKQRNVVVGEDEDGDGIDFVDKNDIVPITPTVSPSAMPTTSLYNTYAYQVLEPLVENPILMLYPNTPQGKALAVVAAKETEPHSIVQRFALMVVFFSTGGDSWKVNFDWDDYASSSSETTQDVDVDECNWPGVTLCRNDQQTNQRSVAGFTFGDNNMAGSWPSEACLLQELERIDLAGNFLTGSLPSCLSELSGLTKLKLEGNDNLDSLQDFCESTENSWEILSADCSVECSCCTECF